MRAILVFGAVAFGVSCASATQLGLASFYGAAQGLTAAHRNLPMGTRVRVLNLDNGRSVVVKIVDRGPFIRGRVIDVSTAAAATLGFREAGLAHVRIERISAETLEASADPWRGAPKTSSYAICRDGADRVEHLSGDSFGEKAAALVDDARGCEIVRLRLLPLAESADDLAPVVAALTAVHASGVEEAASIPVRSLADMEAAESIPVGALALSPDRQASVPGGENRCAAASCAHAPAAQNPVAFLFAELRKVFD